MRFCRLCSSWTLLLGATAFSLFYRRDYDYGQEVLTPFFVDNSVALSVRRAIGSQFDVVGNVARYRYAYHAVVADALAAEPALDRIDTTDNYGFSVGYRLRPKARLGVGLSYWTRASTALATRNYDGVRVAMSMTFLP